MIKKPKIKYEEYNIKTRLKDLREERDLKQQQVADILNIDQRQYSTYETGRRGLSVYQLKTLATYYNTSIDYILYMTDERKAYKKSLVDWEKS